ncbi:MAG: carbamoyltransferase HypF [Thermodesulfobacteriota bacterium]|nr:carbamoyltransferase HypF [Thermodesulfobacteriota bacterium]
MTHRLKATVHGVVQGVGFRPFIYNLAREKELCGYVSNTSAGVDIEVEGEPEQIDRFFKEIEAAALPLARIRSIQKTPLNPFNYQNFAIRKSISLSHGASLIPPDICVCEDCLREMLDPGDRRYGYPFINCTNCGPRYTIISDMPYDRRHTCMKDFMMCGDCLKEYNDPSGRRFHAQPNACPACGPRISLCDGEFKPVETRDPISKSGQLLKEGHILAIKGLGGFHLSVDAENNEAVIKLRSRKHREEKPLALMSYDLTQIRKYAHVGPAEEALLTSSERPIVILKKKEPNSISPEISPRNKNFGVMLPYTPVHYLLLNTGLPALVMTSGNPAGEPIAIGNDEAFERLGHVADYFLIHDRDIYVRSDDSIAQKISGRTRLIRRSRGYVPEPISLKKKFPQILACGAESKNTVCLTKGKYAFVSRHIGDLRSLESCRFFQMTIQHLKKIFDIAPVTIAYDLHPDYLSTLYALEQTDMKKIGVQHHHAHIVSCMTEHGIDGPVIGLAFDGAGYGTDGRIWGGEALLAHAGHFTRTAHLEYVHMPGGAAAVKEPWRMAVSYLRHTFGDGLWDLDLPLFRNMGEKKIEIILKMMEKGINCPETSSLGRLFDGIAAILGIRYQAAYEGQAAVELEMAIKEAGEDSYPYEWQKEKQSHLISLAPIIRGVVNDIRQGKRISSISHRFHLTLIRLFADLCTQLGQETGVDRVVLSGGVFQNKTLLTGLEEALKKKGFCVFSHARVPANDGGISLGQAAISAEMMSDER